MEWLTGRFGLAARRDPSPHPHPQSVACGDPLEACRLSECCCRPGKHRPACAGRHGVGHQKRLGRLPRPWAGRSLALPARTEYAGKKDAAITLAESIRNGGSGKRGPVPMPAQTALSDVDVKTLSMWILAGAKQPPCRARRLAGLWRLRGRAARRPRDRVEAPAAPMRTAKPCRFDLRPVHIFGVVTLIGALLWHKIQRFKRSRISAGHRRVLI